jgi:hypothetical protein
MSTPVPAVIPAFFTIFCGPWTSPHRCFEDTMVRYRKDVSLWSGSRPEEGLFISRKKKLIPDLEKGYMEENCLNIA